jgi:hypothetical protein
LLRADGLAHSSERTWSKRETARTTPVISTD